MSTAPDTVGAGVAPKRKKAVKNRARKPQPPPRVTRWPKGLELSAWPAPALEISSVQPRAFAGIQPAASAAAPAEMIALGGLALAILLLGLAAIPEWIVRPGRAAMLLVQWRVQLAASGLSALFAALIVFLMGTSRL